MAGWNWPDYTAPGGAQSARRHLEAIRTRWGANSPSGRRATDCINGAAPHDGHDGEPQPRIDEIYASVVRARNAPTEPQCYAELEHPVPGH